MKEEQDYVRDLADIRSMMERSSRFVLLSGWAPVLAGLFAMAGAYIAYRNLSFNPDRIDYMSGDTSGLQNVILLGAAVFILSAASATIVSARRAAGKGAKLWNPVTRRLLVHLMLPMTIGGLLMLIFAAKGLAGLMLPISLIFYGVGLFNCSRFTYNELRFLGLLEIAFGLISAVHIDHGLLFWALGFGVAHILFGIYVHFKYER